MKKRGFRVLSNQKIRSIFRLGLIVVVILLIAPPRAIAQEPSDQSSPTTTIDDLFAEVGTRVPAFGGLFVDDAQDTLYVYMVPGQAGDAAGLDQALTDVLGEQRPPQTHLVTLVGQYTFRQLKAWDDRMTPQVLAIPGTVLTDIDDARNRLTIGIENWDLLAAVEIKLAALDIPREAVDIEQMPAAEAEQTLQDFHRPLVGGIQIQNNTGGICTLGFIADRAGVRGLVTNSHCTNIQGGVEGTLFYQAVSPAPNVTLVGIETVDPCYFPAPGCPAPFLSGCPQGRICRFSDSAFARIVSAVLAPVLGKIARPTFNTINWDGISHFYIVAKGNLAVVGTTVQKVGRTTGWTQGNVTRVCATINQAGNNITLLCQNQATYASAGGDSGSPVFGIYRQGPIWTVALVGLHWGSGGSFSPIGGKAATFFGATSGVQSGTELGPLTVCLGGPC
jgi:hypothetical protein